jgi:hypothetical protein
MILSLPWLLVSVIVYNIIVFLFGPDKADASGVFDPSIVFNEVLFQVPMLSGATWSFTLGNLLVILSLGLLFLEILKATRTGGNSLVDHALSTLVFVICLIEFLVVKEAATSVFFIIMIICLIDVIAGFSVTIRAARRDLNVGAGLPTH